VISHFISRLQRFKSCLSRPRALPWAVTFCALGAWESTSRDTTNPETFQNPQFLFAAKWSNLAATKRAKREINERETKDMPQSLSSILIHLIFSTKHREPFITPEIETELHPYMASIFRGMKSPSLALDGTPDHIHALFSLSRVITIAQLVEELKTESSKWIKTKGQEFRNFHWQNGYGAFSIAQSQVSTVKRYIARQKVRHGKMTFQDEYRRFLKSYGIDYDERYVWD